MLEQSLPFRPQCLRNAAISTLLLKTGARNRLTLAQIGRILCRPDDDDTQLSDLEKLVITADEVCGHLESDFH